MEFARITRLRVLWLCARCMKVSNSTVCFSLWPTMRFVHAPRRYRADRTHIFIRRTLARCQLLQQFNERICSLSANFCSRSLGISNTH